jgi:hypothetical protein
MPPGGAQPPRSGRAPTPPALPVGSQLADAYLQCLEENSQDAEPCRALTKQYLECRMQR